METSYHAKDQPSHIVLGLDFDSTGDIGQAECDVCRGELFEGPTGCSVDGLLYQTQVFLLEKEKSKLSDT